MYMTEGEICNEYRLAKFKDRQIKILAQLNATTVQKIQKILIENGYDEQYLERERKNTTEHKKAVARYAGYDEFALREMITKEKQKLDTMIEALNLKMAN